VKISWQTEWPLWVAIAVLFVIAAAAWPYAPDKMPAHWNIRGEVDRYGGKIEGLLAIPLVTAGLYLLLTFLPRIDPKSANYEKFAKAYTVIRYAIVGFLAVIYVAVLMASFGQPIRIGSVVLVAAGLLFIVLGSLLDKIRPNWFVGIRTPWTLSSDESWMKTHRLGRWVFINSGLLMMLSGIIQSAWTFVGTISVLFCGVIVLVFYSYRVWKEDPHRLAPTWGRRKDA